MIVALLTEHMERFVAPGANTVVFTSVRGSLLLNRYFSPFWTRAKRDAAVDESVRFHDLRHLADTAAATAGGSLREVMARMGHQSSNAALRYLKAAEARDREISEAIGARLANGAKPAKHSQVTQRAAEDRAATAEQPAPARKLASPRPRSTHRSG